jgi:hypothetical protein
MKTGQVWFSNGRFLLEPTIIIPNVFGPPSCFSHLKSGQNNLVIKWPFKNLTILSSLNHFKAIKLTIWKLHHLNIGTKNIQLVEWSGF